MNKNKEKFAVEYIKDYNGTRAYLRVSPDTNRGAAAQQASRWLKEPEVLERIHELQKYEWEAQCVNAERIGNGLASIAFDEEKTLPQRLKAFDLLQKQLSLQIQKVEANVSTDINITIGGIDDAANQPDD